MLVSQFLSLYSSSHLLDCSRLSKEQEGDIADLGDGDDDVAEDDAVALGDGEEVMEGSEGLSDGEAGEDVNEDISKCEAAVDDVEALGKSEAVNDGAESGLKMTSATKKKLSLAS